MLNKIKLFGKMKILKKFWPLLCEISAGDPDLKFTKRIFKSHMKKISFVRIKHKIFPIIKVNTFL